MITVSFTDRAKESLSEILHFLRERWTQKQIDELHSDLEQLISVIEDNTLKHPFYKSSNIRKALIAKRQVTVFYKETGQHQITILLIWPNKKNPKTLRSLLK